MEKILRFLFRKRINKKWRKNIKVVDKCFFVNILGTKTSSVIKDIAPTGLVHIESTLGMRSIAYQWMEPEKLRIV